MVAQTSTLRIIVDSRNAQKSAEDFDKTLKSIEKDGISASKSMDGMGGSLKSLAGYMAGIVSVSKAIAMADGYTQMAARIRNATSSAQEYSMVQDRILETANGTYRSLSEAQEVYLSLAGGMKSLGKTTADTLDVADSLSYAFVANAARADQAQSAMDALNKSMAKGKIDADAWISIVSAADNVIADMAKHTGKTEAQIRQLGVTGKISLTDFLEMLKATRLENKALADNMENSLADGMQKLTNSITVYLGKANEATSATGQMAAALGVFGDNIDLVFGAAFVAAVGLGTKALITKGIAVKAAIADSMALRQATIAEQQAQLQALGTEALRQKQLMAMAITEVDLARKQYNSAQTQNERAAATMRLTQAEIAYNVQQKASTASTLIYDEANKKLNATQSLGNKIKAASMALVGGPAGLALLVAGAAASYLLMSRNADENTKSLRADNEAVGDAIQKYRELDEVKRRAQLVSEKEQLEELAGSYDTLKGKLTTNAYSLSRHNDLTSEQSKQVNALIGEFKRTGDLDKFSSAINKLNFLSQELKDRFNALAGQVQNAGDKYRDQKKFVDAASGSMDNNAVSANNAAAANRNAAAAVQEYTDKLRGQKWDLEFTNALVDKHGYSARKADLTLQAYRENEKKGIKGVTSEQKKLISGIEAEEKAAQKRLESQRAAASAQKKSISASTALAKKQQSEALKLQKQADNLANQQYQSREDIQYRYAERSKQIELNLAKEIKEIQEANFDPKDANGYIQNAKNRAELEKQLYIEQLAAQLNEWNESELEKLDRKVRINELMIKLDSEMNDEFKDQALKSLRDQSNYAAELIELRYQKQELEAEKANMTETEYMLKRYELELAEINKIADARERAARAGALAASTHESYESKKKAAQDGLDSLAAEMTGQSGLYALQKNMADQEAVLDNARKFGLLKEEEYKLALLQVEENYQRAKLDLNLSYGEQIFGSMASMFDKNDDRQKKYYKALITMEKTVAITRSMIAIQAGVAQAASLPFPANLGAMATVAMEGASIISNLRAIKAEGFAEGGYTGNGGKYDVAGLVHKGEVVFSKADVARNGGVQAVESMRKGESNGANIVVQPNVIINIPEGMGATRNVSSDGTITIDVIDGWNQTLLANPNSKTRKGLAQNTTAGARR